MTAAHVAATDTTLQLSYRSVRPLCLTPACISMVHGPREEGGGVALPWTAAATANRVKLVQRQVVLARDAFLDSTTSSRSRPASPRLGCVFPPHSMLSSIPCVQPPVPSHLLSLLLLMAAVSLRHVHPRLGRVASEEACAPAVLNSSQLSHTRRR